MRRAFRVTAAVLLSYLFQATVLPYFKINGVMLDLASVTLITIGFSCGVYVGITGGLFAALLMEVVTGDLAGLTAVACIAAGAFGAWVAKRVREYKRVGKRRQERLVKQLAPMVAAGLFVGLKEAIYVVYFYLTGVDIEFIHIFKIVVSIVETALMSLVLMPLINGLLLRKQRGTPLIRWFGKRVPREKNARQVPEKVMANRPSAPQAFVADADGSPDADGSLDDDIDVVAEEAPAPSATKPALGRDGADRERPADTRRRAQRVYGENDLPPPEPRRPANRAKEGRTLE